MKLIGAFWVQKLIKGFNVESDLKVVEPIVDVRSAGLITQIERIASDPNVDINKLEALWGMQKEEQGRQAKMAYNGAMSAMQSVMPIIKKSGLILDNSKNVRSKYAKYEDVIAAVQPLLITYGFSVSFKTEFNNSCLQVTGVVSHAQGHEESTIMTLPFDDSGAKNKVQAIGSSVSYGKRYCLCMLLNIAASGEDDDGNKASDNEEKKAIYARDKLVAMGIAVRNNIESIIYVKENIKSGDLLEAAVAYFEISQEDQEALEIAPTKGGIFETHERKFIKEQACSLMQESKKGENE